MEGKQKLTRVGKRTNRQGSGFGTTEVKTKKYYFDSIFLRCSRDKPSADTQILGC